MEQTPMMQLIENLSKKSIIGNSEVQRGFKAGIRKAIPKATELLELEKKIIVDAYEKCQDDCFVNGQGDTWVDNKTTGEQYYTNTFKIEK